MRNRGIPHDVLTWNDNESGGGSWLIHTNTELFGSVQVDIPAKSRSDTLTEIQQRSLQMLRELPKALRASLTDSLRRYALQYMGEELSAEECTLSCDNASIPYLHDANTPYAFLNADSDIDEEHGVCFLIRDGVAIACCHGDESLEFYGWDATDELDALAQIGE